MHLNAHESLNDVEINFMDFLHWKLLVAGFGPKAYASIFLA
jgi:hypothetical protein